MSRLQKIACPVRVGDDQFGLEEARILVLGAWPSSWPLTRNRVTMMPWSRLRTWPLT